MWLSDGDPCESRDLILPLWNALSGSLRARRLVDAVAGRQFYGLKHSVDRAANRRSRATAPPGFVGFRLFLLSVCETGRRDRHRTALPFNDSFSGLYPLPSCLERVPAWV